MCCVLERCTVLTFCLGSVLCIADSDNGIAAYKAGDYQTAIPLLEAAAPKTPKDPAIRAALLSALVYEGKVEQASDAADFDAAEFPNSPEVIAARGEFAYYVGDMPEADRLFRGAAKLKDQTARAYYGLYRLYYAASMHRAARLLLMRAQEIDPDHALITRAWLRYLVSEKRKQVEAAFIAAHPWFYKHLERDRNTGSEVEHEQISGNYSSSMESVQKRSCICFRSGMTRAVSEGLACNSKLMEAVPCECFSIPAQAVLWSGRMRLIKPN